MPDQKDSKRASATVPPAGTRQPRGGRGPRPADDANVGGALRAAYQSAVEEAVPQEMLDLLDKLR